MAPAQEAVNKRKGLELPADPIVPIISVSLIVRRPFVGAGAHLELVPLASIETDPTLIDEEIDGTTFREHYYDQDKAYDSLKKADWFMLIDVQRNRERLYKNAVLAVEGAGRVIHISFDDSPDITRTYRSLSALVHFVYGGLAKLDGQSDSRLGEKRARAMWQRWAMELPSVELVQQVHTSSGVHHKHPPLFFVTKMYVLFD